LTDETYDGKSRRLAWFTVSILAILSMTFAQGVSALTLEPTFISGAEGSVIELNILIAADDWFKPSAELQNKCADAGVGAELVARYSLKRVSGSATFSTNETSGDLHLESNGVPKGDLTILWCAPGWYPEDYLDVNRSIVFHEDGESEGTETATLELWSIDINNRETFAGSSRIAIDDYNGPQNTNGCSSAPLSDGAPGSAGSISESDCDSSPRGNGYFADIHTFVGNQGEEILVQADWVDLDGYLYLEAPDGSIEDKNDNYTDTSKSKIERALNQSGTYKLWATTYNPNDTGDYQIVLTRGQAAEDQVDWQLTTVAVTPTNLIQNDMLSISVSGQSDTPPSVIPGGGVDVQYLLSSDAEISVSDTPLGSENYCCGAGFDGVWQGTVDVSPGTWWVGACITSTDADSANNCTSGTEITVGASLATSCNSRVLDCGASVGGSLDESSCTGGPQGPGYYAEKFTVLGQSGATLWLDAGWESDGYLFLKDPRGKVVAENDNYTGTEDAHIEYSPSENGTYSVWASSYEPGAMGAFELSLNCDPPAGPDLTLETSAIQSADLLPGQSIGLTVQVNNSGDQPADSSTLHFVLSSDYRIDFADPEIGTEGVSGLLAADSTVIDTVLAGPVTPGTYWIGVCADAVADEAAVSNNCSAGLRIDVMPSPECNDFLLACGESVTSIINAKDCVGSPRGAGFLGEVLTVDVNADEALMAEASWFGTDGHLLLEDPSGNVVSLNDDADDVQHSRIEYRAETSGIHRFWATTLQRGALGSYQFDVDCDSAPAPDLVASAVTLDTNEAVVSDTVSVSATVYNDGKRSSESSTVFVMLSSDEIISAGDPVIASQILDAVPPLSSLDIQLAVNVPDQSGNYWLGICVEPVAGEVLTVNNCTSVENQEPLSSAQAGQGGSKSGPRSYSNAGTLIEVSNGADCTGSSLTCGQSGSGKLGKGDCDMGPRGTGYFSDVWSFQGNAGDSVSLDTQWSGLDGYLYLVSPTGALAGENDDSGDTGHSRLEYVLQETGKYSVWPSAHDQGQGGNYKLSLTCNAPSAPDLKADAPQLDATTLRPGQSLMLSTEVLNQGNEDSASSSVRFILAGASTLSPGDRVLASTDVPVLAPGESSLESMAFAIDAAPGTYWIAACVDGDVHELDSDNNCALTGPLTVEQNNRPIDINAGLNDAWFNPATPGQGFFINVFPDGRELYVSWFTFDVERPEAGVPFVLGDAGHRWLTALGTYDRGVAQLKIYLNQGGVFDQASPAPTESVYGTMTVTFSDCNHGQIEFDLPSVGEHGTIPITRVATDNLNACEVRAGELESQPHGTVEQTSKTANSAFTINPGLNDAWYNPATGGQGLSFNVFPRLGSAFVSWFTYDTERPPADVTGIIDGPGLRWLTALGAFEGDTAELTLYRVGGGVFNSAEPPPEETKYGTITVHFDDCNSGELQYDIPSLSLAGTVPIQRITTDTVPVCEQAQMSADRIALQVSPGNKALLENFCGGSSAWLFDWPDTPQASGYLVELWRNDALTPMTFAVNESEFEYQKDTPVPGEHQTGWQWRYRPLYTAPGKNSGFSPSFTFDVGSCE